MASVGTVKFLLCLILWLWNCNFLPHCQGKQEYPFIKKASTFSSPSISTTSINKAYDYIIVGGGTAGCPLAATLSQNFSVLVLERGGVPFTNPNVTFLENFHITLADLSPTSASQYFVSTDGVFNARGRVLGGGSSINAGFYTRASSRFINKAGWDVKLVNESYPWVEKQIVHRPKFSPFQRAVRDSLIDNGVSPFNGFTYDHIYGTKVGGTIFDRFGRRHTAAELLASGNPDKLTVLVHATVQKIVFDTTGKRPKAIGVIFNDENGKQHEARLGNDMQSEVILSSGAIGSPQMLLLSGIGPKDELQNLNISVVLNNPFVGKGMIDNPMNTVFVPSNRPVHQSLIQTVGITKKGIYIEASSGFSQSNSSIHCHHGIMSPEIGQLHTIPPKQRSIEAIEAYKKNKRDIPVEAFKGGFVLSKVGSAWSVGELKLVNTNVNENPAVTFNYFSHPYDLKRCVEGISMAIKVVQSEHFTNYTLCKRETAERLLNLSVKTTVNFIPKHANDTSSLEQFCKDTVITIWHYHGGCHVGKVVSPDYKVLDVDRLRVVDGSTFTESPGTNPQATVMMMGRYMGVKILRGRLGRLAGI
ncbi:putative glucose-methanol-choline oxidoreductase, FAD/NAD(P)-binding domain-containing protein [Medicago truncatula]|uniref:Glucose-methanol-choline (GMC) oxidoreductase family protein n=1 Tax=Medicago truncatula TaxID=3880 RepID=A0A072TXW2_MEDTR|nr:protein HOTHEAD [Medicago truncatula]KEH18350.1 glucose-methanol-choline (GMC) oxidoreductase family protein [Medicago truncatula]RHN39274.1 putative glucose-methanol-choline oxidoreductase, FAD/NAD(P)-binding domain-containing protein [Medicago truncatula]